MSYGDSSIGDISYSGSADLVIDAAAVVGSPNVGSFGTNQTLSRALTTIFATGSPGSVSTSAAVSITITAPAITGGIGTIGFNQVLTRTLSGNLFSGSVNTVTSTQALSRAISNVVSTGFVNSITFSTTSTRSISGSQVDSNVGNFGTNQVLFRSVSGNSIAAVCDSIGFYQELSRELAGVEGRLWIGYETPSAAVSILIGSNKSDILVGNIGTSAAASQTMSGVLSVGSIKSISTNNEISNVNTGYFFGSIPYSVTNYFVQVNTKESKMVYDNKSYRIIVTNK